MLLTDLGDSLQPVAVNGRIRRVGDALFVAPQSAAAPAETHRAAGLLLLHFLNLALESGRLLYRRDQDVLQALCLNVLKLS